MKKITLSLAVVFCVLFLPFFAYSQEEELGIYEKLDEYLPEDLIFTNEDYEEVNLLEIIDKPTVIVPVYYNCPGICSPLLEGVADVIGKANIGIGKDYQVYTVSFAPNETATLAREKKATFVKLVKNDEQDVENGWRFFVGDSVNINRLLNSIGYKIKKTGVDYIHPGAIVVVSQEGKITRYLHGVYFLPFDLKMAVVEASQGKSGPTINKFLKYCFSYDPAGKKYVFNITKISGTVILFFAVLLLLVMIFRKGKKRTRFSKQKAD